MQRGSVDRAHECERWPAGFAGWHELPAAGVARKGHFDDAGPGQKIKQLVQAGATVGPRPTASPSLSDFPQCDAEVTKLAAEVWGDCDGKTVTEHDFGKGRVSLGSTA
jgi:hypothetical protein